MTLSQERCGPAAALISRMTRIRLGAGLLPNIWGDYGDEQILQRATDLETCWPAVYLPEGLLSALRPRSARGGLRIPALL